MPLRQSSSASNRRVRSRGKLAQKIKYMSCRLTCVRTRTRIAPRLEDADFTDLHGRRRIRDARQALEPHLPISYVVLMVKFGSVWGSAPTGACPARPCTYSIVMETARSGVRDPPSIFLLSLVWVIWKSFCNSVSNGAVIHTWSKLCIRVHTWQVCLADWLTHRHPRSCAGHPAAAFIHFKRVHCASELASLYLVTLIE